MLHLVVYCQINPLISNEFIYFIETVIKVCMTGQDDCLIGSASLVLYVSRMFHLKVSLCNAKDIKNSGTTYISKGAFLHVGLLHAEYE